MNFQQAVASVFRNYANFNGRAARSEYWWFVLFSFLVSAVLTLIDGSGLLSGIWSLIVLLPSLAVGARRLHDTDRSGWWLLIMLVPLIGFIVLIWFFVTRGNDGPNRFGADPLGENGALAA
jgi:uncharacterized membrane protein YhaH (DUF805 family)